MKKVLSIVAQVLLIVVIFAAIDDHVGLDRQEQIELMAECIEDAEQVAIHNPGEKYHLSSLMPITTIAVSFFEYRLGLTEGR